MWIIGVDYHPSVQQIAFVNTDTGECGERRLSHSDGEAEKFYRELKAAGCKVRVGMEVTGHARWFERLLAELGFELWIGDPAQIKAKRVRKQKTDRLDAALLLQLLLEDRFPRVWVPSRENRDLRQLLWHRHRLVQMRTRIMNQLQAVALNEGVRHKKALWNKSGRAQAFVLIIDSAERFACGKQIASYVGLIPCEDSSADRRRLGHITKQGNTLLRFLLVEAAQAVVRRDPDWRRRYTHLAMRRERPIAKVAMARKLAVRLYWMMRKEWNYEQLKKFGSYAGESDYVHGVQ